MKNSWQAKSAVRFSGSSGMGWKRFCAAYRVPGETEYGLLVWTNELLESTLWKMGRKAA